MENQMSIEMANCLKELSEQTGLAIDWSTENLAPYLAKLYERIVQWLIMEKIIGIGIAAGVTILCLIIFAFMVKRYKKEQADNSKNGWFYSYYDEGVGATAVVLGVFLLSTIIICVIISGYYAIEIVKLNTVPEASVLKYIQSILWHAKKKSD